MQLSALKIDKVSASSIAGWTVMNVTSLDTKSSLRAIRTFATHVTLESDSVNCSGEPFVGFGRNCRALHQAL